jgi:tetratricopeptide (TPR) repeat protein
MIESPNADPLRLTYGAEFAEVKESRLSKMLSNLAFKEHGLRLGLELSLIFVCYFTLELWNPWSSLKFEVAWGGIYSWFSACLFVAAIDRILMSKPLWILQQSMRFDLLGAYDRALLSLKNISPHSDSLVRYPVAAYHLRRMKIYCHAQDFLLAEHELTMAKQAGLPLEKWFLAKSYFLRAQGKFFEAIKELERATVSLGNTPLLKLEYATLLYETRENFWQIKDAFKEVMKLPDTLTECGDSSVLIASCFWEIARLKTGHAEEAIFSLSDLITRYQHLARYCDSVRPHLSLILLERSLYYATHHEPDAALMDLKEARLLCTYPKHQKLSAEVAEELKWRHTDLFAT